MGISLGMDQSRRRHSLPEKKEEFPGVSGPVSLPSLSLPFSRRTQSLICILNKHLALNNISRAPPFCDLFFSPPTKTWDGNWRWRHKPLTPAPEGQGQVDLGESKTSLFSVESPGPQGLPRKAVSKTRPKANNTNWNGLLVPLPTRSFNDWCK